MRRCWPGWCRAPVGPTFALLVTDTPLKPDGIATTTLIVTTPPASSVPRLQVTIPADAPQEPWLADGAREPDAERQEVGGHDAVLRRRSRVRDGQRVAEVLACDTG